MALEQFPPRPTNEQPPRDEVQLAGVLSELIKRGGQFSLNTPIKPLFHGSPTPIKKFRDSPVHLADDPRISEDYGDLHRIEAKPGKVMTREQATTLDLLDEFGDPRSQIADEMGTYPGFADMWRSLAFRELAEKLKYRYLLDDEVSREADLPPGMSLPSLFDSELISLHPSFDLKLLDKKQ
tara:strand:+ start:2250 stop:2792 length:543 start_codon:yes stop_codon:yes gene_type:complete